MFVNVPASCTCAGGKAATGKACTGVGITKCASCSAGFENPGAGCTAIPSGLRCGAAVCEYDWTNIGGTRIADLKKVKRFPNSPDNVLALTAGGFEMAKRGNNLGAMLEGYVVAPVSGDYVFLTHSDDSSEVWAASKPMTQSGLVKVVELNGCCRTVTGKKKLKWKAGNAYYIRALVKEGGGGEYLRVGARVGKQQWMPIPVAAFVSVRGNVCKCSGGSGAYGYACPKNGASLCASCSAGTKMNKAKTACAKATSGLRCGAAVCEYAWTGIGGTKVSDLTNNKRYPNSPNAVRKLTSGRFEMKQRGNNLGAVLEGFVKAPTTGKYTFSTHSDDASEVWAASKPNTQEGLVKVVELTGCCRRINGRTQLSWTAGQAYYIRALVKEGGGGEYLRVGMAASASPICQVMQIGRGPVVNKVFRVNNKAVKCPREINKKNWLGTDTYGDKFRITHVANGIKVARTDTGKLNAGWGMNLRFKCCAPAPRAKQYFPIPVSMFVNVPASCTCAGGKAATGKACTGVGITKCASCKMGFENPGAGCPAVKSGLRCGAAVCEYDWTNIGGTRVSDLTKNKH